MRGMPLLHDITQCMSDALDAQKDHQFQRYPEQKVIRTEECDTKSQEELNKQITQAIKAVESALFPLAKTLLEEVYVQMPWHPQKQLEPLRNRS